MENGIIKYVQKQIKLFNLFLLNALTKNTIYPVVKEKQLWTETI